MKIKNKANKKHVQSFKELICSNNKCLSSVHNNAFNCYSCGKAMYKFDSQGEARRYKYLVRDKGVKMLFLHKKFKLYNPILSLKYLGGYSDDYEVNNFLPFKFASSDLEYTCDFVYDHPDHLGRLCIEDYKPCGIERDKKGRRKLRILYQGDSYLRIRQVARQYQEQYVVMVSYYDGKQYHESFINPK